MPETAPGVQVSPQVLRFIIGRETPSAWDVVVRSAKLGNGGLCRFLERQIEIPALRFGYRTLWVFFHECAHARRFDADGVSTSSLAEEAVAELFAARRMSAWGFRVTPEAALSAERNLNGHRVVLRRLLEG